MASSTTSRRQGLTGDKGFKAPVRAGTTANITLSGEQTVDGVAVKAVGTTGYPDRVLVKNQTNPIDNGIWDVSTAAWSRSLDANGTQDLVTGTGVTITEGTQALQYWFITTTGSIIPGSTSMVWAAGNPGLTALAASTGSSLVGFIQSGTGAVPTTEQAELRLMLRATQFMTAAQVTDVQNRTLLLDVTTPINNAITQAKIADARIWLPSGSYSILADSINLLNTIGVSFEGPALNINSGGAVLKARSAGSYLVQLASTAGNSTYSIVFQNITFDGAALVTDVVKCSPAVTGEVTYIDFDSCEFLNVKTAGSLVANYTAAAVFAESALWTFTNCGFACNGAVGFQGVAVKLNNYGAWGWTFRDCHFDTQTSPCHFQMTAGQAVLDNCKFDNTAVTSTDIQFYNSASLTLNNCSTGTNPGPFLISYNKTTTGKYDNYPLVINNCQMQSLSAGANGIQLSTPNPLHVNGFYGSNIQILSAPAYASIENATYTYNTNRSAVKTIIQKAGATNDAQVWMSNDTVNQLSATWDTSAAEWNLVPYKPGTGYLPLRLNGPIRFTVSTSKIIGITRVGNAADSSVSYTGVGFKPSSVDFIIEGATYPVCTGFATVADQRSVAQEAGVSMGTLTTAAIYITTAGATQWLKGSLTSMDADGFTISWTHSGLGATTFNISCKCNI